FADRVLLVARPVLAAEFVLERREQTEIDIHGLIAARTLVIRRQMPTGHVREQGAEGGCRGRSGEFDAVCFRRREAAREQPDGGALDIAFAAGDLPREAYVRLALEPKLGVEQSRRVDIGVAV